MSTDPADPVLARAVELLESGCGSQEFVGGVDAQLVRRLLGVAVSLYARRAEIEGGIPAFTGAPENTPSATEVCIASSRMLEALSIEIFELAMWNTWGGVAPDQRGEQ